MLKTKEYRICDRCFQELTENGHTELCDVIDMNFYDLCEKCFEEYMSYTAEMDELNLKRDDIAEKYKFGKYLPKEGKDE